MVRSILTALLAGVVWVAFAALPPMLPASTMSFSSSALAATTVNTSKSNTFKVTAVDAKARTFTAVGKDGKQVTFAAPKGKPLPEVGKVYDITYTESPGGGPLQSIKLNSSRSNVN